ncbi:MAG: hypothetical protein F4Z51_12650 [Chloroflexi bacterium]|nr:hypothetical protein [Chloroflexota bacterium]MYD17948.1 hypothetical protein [Chloroflexota bacterium]
MAANDHIRYEPDEPVPPLLTLNVAFQGMVLIVSNTVTFVVIFSAAFNDDGGYMTWAIVGALIVAGISTALHASKIGRLGPGHVLLMGSGVPFLAACVLAVEQGGLALMSSLVIASSLVQFLVASRLAQLRRLITPVVSGVAFMMIALSAMPIALGRLTDVPDGAADAAGPGVGLATLAITALLMLLGSGLWRLWALPIALVAGCAIAVPLGVYDIQRALDAPWFDLPEVAGWPGFGSVLDEDFWALLLVFLVVSAVVAVRSSSEGAAIQQASRREPRSIDFRGVQRTLNVGGIAIFLSGIAGTPPTIAYLPSTISLFQFTGVAARRVGIVIGVMLIVAALLPKIVAMLLTIPRPVSGALLLVIMGLLFVEGMRTVLRDGLNRQRAGIVGISLSIAVGLQSQNILADVIGGTWGATLGNGVVFGVTVAVLLTVVLELAGSRPRPRRLETELDVSALPGIEAFLRQLGADLRWNQASIDRLHAAGEETLSAMLNLRDDYESDQPPRLALIARPAGGSVELEFLALFSEENLEDRVAYLSEQAEEPEVGDISFRLLRFYASSVRHRKYYGIDIVTVEVEGSRA